MIDIFTGTLVPAGLIIAPFIVVLILKHVHHQRAFDRAAAETHRRAARRREHEAADDFWTSP